jgi:long-subunit fatty acid transport protein
VKRAQHTQHTLRALCVCLYVGCVACVVGATPDVAQAGLFDFFGLSGRDVGMAGASAAIVDDHTAAFLNPAALTQRKVVQLGASFLAVAPSLSTSQPPTEDDRLMARDPQTQAGVSVGAVFPFGGKVDNRVALGVVIYIPTQDVLGIDTLDPQTPRWYRYHAALDRLYVSAALAVEPFPNWSIGIGFQALAGLDGAVNVDLDIINDQITRRDLQVSLVNKAALIAGLHGAIPDLGLRLGASYRGPLDLSYDIPLRFDLGADAYLDLLVRGTDLYTPHTITVGAAFDLPNAPLLLTLDARLALWSLAPDPSMHVTILGGGDLLSALGLDSVLAFDTGRVAPPGFRDAYSVHLGAEYKALPWLLLRGGYAWRQSAVAPQTGTTSYLDSDAHQAALGVGFSVPDPLALNDRPLTLDASALATFHPSQTVQKSTPGDPLGSLTYGGQLWTFALSARHDF